MKVTILDDWADTLRTLPCYDLLSNHTVRILTEPLTEDGISKAASDAEALVLFRERTPVTASLLDGLPNLCLISMRGAHPHIDLDACRARGVTVCSDTAGTGTNYAAAELTLALLMAAARRIPQNMQAMREGRWQVDIGMTLRGRTLGIWGHGRIGRALAGYAEALGMRVVWHGSEAARERVEAEGGTFVNRRTLFAESDAVSLHLRLVPETRGIVTAGDLALMLPHAIFVNTSRAGLIAPGALSEALKAGRPGYAAIDVFDEEPTATDPLLSMPNVVATPHLGFVTTDELDRQFADAFAQVNAFADGTPINVVT